MSKALAILLFAMACSLAAGQRQDGTIRVTASDAQPEFEPMGASDGDRFQSGAHHAWKGKAGATSWWWEAHFATPRTIGGLLQIEGDHAFVLQNAPRDYLWEWSDDGEHWQELVHERNEQRTFRVHRFSNAVTAAYLRMRIERVEGAFPTIREVELFSRPDEPVRFPEWIVAVNTTDVRKVPNEGQQFVPLARSCRTNLEAQQIWVGDFNPRFVAMEPRPVCAFLSGNFKDWCQISREPWRGTEQILKTGAVPMWASCGGAQGLALLSEVGVDSAWDCPHCRDPKAPKSPIYGHIGHKDGKPANEHVCGDYSGCIFERGPHAVRRVKEDAAFSGLPDEFKVMESHCGQIERPPNGWELLLTAGAGTTTKMQCLRLKEFPIYAAQFHIELEGTPESSQRIMENFLRIAEEWHARF